MTNSKKPLIIQLDGIRFAQEPWKELEKVAEVIHLGEEIYSREQFIKDLHGKYSNVVGIGRGYLTRKKVGLFDKELISHFPSSVKFVAHQGAGYDEIDAVELGKRGIQLSNCPNIVSESTADKNIFLMIGAMRNFMAGRQRLLDGKWKLGEFAAGVKEGWNPSRKVLGIIGMGSIGRAVRDRAEPMGFEKIVYYNRSKLSPELEKNSEYISSLEKLVSVADVISINCPLNESTFHIINEDLISKMKGGVIIINTARGAVINEQDLIKNLKSGKIGAAGLDVFETEPSPPKQLLGLPNVLALPHMGTHAIQTVYDIENFEIKNLYSGIKTGKLLTIVPEQKDIDFK